MKNIILLCLLFIGSATFAQKINFKSKDAREVAGIHTRFNCTLTELSSKAQAEEIAAKMKAVPGVLKLDVINPTATTAELIIITEQANNTMILQNALKAVKLDTFMYDDKVCKTGEINNIITPKK